MTANHNGSLLSESLKKIELNYFTQFSSALLVYGICYIRNVEIEETLSQCERVERTELLLCI